MEVILGIFGIIAFFGIYLLLAILFERYLGWSLLYSMTHRGAKRINDQRRQIKLRVNKFAHENPDIFKQIVVTINKKRFAKTPANFDFLISSYIKCNPSWADAEYEEALIKYNKDAELKKQNDQAAEAIEHLEFIDLAITKGMTQQEAEQFYEEFRKERPFQKFELYSDQPTKKIYK